MSYVMSYDMDLQLFILQYVYNLHICFIYFCIYLMLYFVDVKVKINVEYPKTP